jgi:hypothetical protein
MTNVLQSSDRGAVTVIVAFVLVILLGFAGLTIDFGYAYLQKARLQAVADAAALACATANLQTPGSCEDGDTALTKPDLLGVVDVGDYPLAVTVPVTCPGSLANDCVQANVTDTWSTFFLGWFSVPTLSVQADAIAGVTGAQTDVPCLLALRTSGQPAHYYNSSELSATCTIASRSSHQNKSIELNSSEVSTTADVLAAGGIQLNSSSLTAGGDVIEDFADPIVNPYEDLEFPSDTCTGKLERQTCTATNPGCYRSIDIDISNCTLTMNAGTYVVYGGDVTIKSSNGIINGDGVTIVGTTRPPNRRGNFEIDLSNGSIDLTAPTSGPYQSIVFAQSPGKTRDFLLKGSNTTFNFSGSIYLPDTRFSLENIEGGTLGSVIAYTLDFNNADNLTVVNTAPGSGSGSGSRVILVD